MLAVRCANLGDVFLGGEIYFTDADCYSRMSRARLCFEHPGLVVRHHSFENYPSGTNPHTTAPLDYLLVALGATLKPFTAHPLELAGAIVSPILGLIGAWFLFWWARQFRWRDRVATLLLYAASPILVHGTQLGRPDHQSLLIVLVTIALCAEWEMRLEPSRFWAILGGGAWSLALWTSLYEPLVLFLIVMTGELLVRRQGIFSGYRRTEWMALVAVLVPGFMIERRIPEAPLWTGSSIAANWSRTIGELAHVSFFDPVWLHWTGYLLFVLPILFWFAYRRGARQSLWLVALSLTTYLLTLGQARWSYFFVITLAILLPFLFAAIPSRTIACAIIGICFFPLLRDWDARLWPNESELALRSERRTEQIELRAAANQLRSDKPEPFLAPWWLSPAVAYWSGQPGVAGSSHEALNGIAESARFFASERTDTARAILEEDGVSWVLAYDSARVTANSIAILGTTLPENPLGQVLDRTPSQAPTFLRLVFQNGACKLFRAQISAEN